MNETCQALLDSLYRDPEQPGADGRVHRVDVRASILRPHGEALYRLALDHGAERTLEIGMANGGSTLFLLAAHADRGKGFHTAVDPFERTSWHGIGLAKVEQSGMAGSFRLIEEPSIDALPALRRAGERFDLILVDGAHHFDAVIVDFHLSDALCAVGGHVVLDDLWMPGVEFAARFIRKNLAYAPVAQPLPYLRVFRKLADDARPWDHYVPFEDKRKPLWKRVRGAARDRGWLAQPPSGPNR